MTVGSLPFVWDLCRAGGDVAGVGRREWLSQGIGSMFTSYLIAVSLYSCRVVLIDCIA